METQTIKVDDDIAKLLREFYADLKVLNERQSEINRRIGLMEGRVNDVVLLKASVDDLKGEWNSSEDTKADWKTYLVQTVLSVILTLVVTWGVAKLGLPIVGS